MPSENDPFNLDSIDDNDPNAPNQLRDAARRGSAAVAENERLKVEIEAVRAGIDTSTRMGQAWLASYNGKVNADAMKADAEEFGLPLRASDPPADPPAGDAATPPADPATDPSGGQVPPEGDGGFAARQALADGAMPPGAANQDIRAASRARAKELMDSGREFGDAAGELIAMRAQAAMEGDPSVILVRGRAAESSI